MGTSARRHPFWWHFRLDGPPTLGYVLGTGLLAVGLLQVVLHATDHPAGWIGVVIGGVQVLYGLLLILASRAKSARIGQGDSPDGNATGPD